MRDLNENDKTIIATLMNQIGGSTFFMLGTQNKGIGVNDKNQPYLSFKIRGSKKVSHIIIAHNAMDLYDMEFIKIWGSKRTIVSTSEGVYSDMLHSIIKDKTGLETSL